MPIDNAQITRTAVRWLLNGTDEIVNVWWHRWVLTAPLDDTDAGTALTDWLEASYALVNGMMSSNVQHLDTQWTNVTTAYPFTPLPRNANLDGQDASDLLPSDTSALVVWRTGVQRKLGRKYLPTFVKTALSGGRWTAGTMTDLALFAAFVALDFVVDPTTTLQPGVRSTVGGAFSSFVSYTVSNVPSRQDRRKLGVGS